MERHHLDLVLRHRGRTFDLSVALRTSGGAVRADDLVEALVPSGALAAVRHLRVGPAAFAPDAHLDVAHLVDGVEVEVVEGPPPHRQHGPWPESGAAAGRPPGPVAVHRPPRSALPPPPAPVALPEPPAPAGRRAPVLGLAALGPVAGAGLLVVVTGDARFAILAALSPLTGAFAALDQRRRNRGESRAEHRRFRLELAAARRDLVAAAAVHRRRLEELAPPVHRAVGRGGWAPGLLWRRRPGDPAFPDHLVLRLGTGEVRWEPPVVPPGRTCDEVRAAVDEASVLRAAPVTLDLGRGGVVGVVGHRAAALAIVRSLVVQAAVHHGPADVRIAVCARDGAGDDWDWTKWLPHVRVPGSGSHGRRMLAAGDEARPLLEALARSRGGPEATEADLLLVLDDPGLAGGRTSPAALVAGTGPPVATIVLAPSIDELPAAATEIVEAGRDDAALVRPQAGERLAFLADGIDDAVARGLARRLARCRDPDAATAGDALPASVPLTGLLGLVEVTPGAIGDRWRRRSGRVAVPIGVGPDGPVTVDLVADGPHALVAGTTGAGKSELLRSLVVGLAASVDPTLLTFVLVDYKGGAAFDACARLPHTVGLVTDLDPGLAERALRCLEAELRHRERTLRSAGCSSLADHLAAGAPGGPLPRLAVVVDEFATLKQEVPGFIDSLVSIAQRGRSLGVHLVLATQRPGGAVSDDIRANTNLRIALRVQDAAESSDVVGTSAAVRLSRDLPGRALVRRGPTELVEVQTAWASGPADRSLPAVWFQPLRFGPGAPAPVALAGDDPPGAPLAALVDAIAAAHDSLGGAAPRRPWVDPLPDVLTVAELAEGGIGEVVLGWADLPDEQRRVPATWQPALGGLLVVGSPGSGTTAALRAVAHGVARAAGPDRCHLYAVDLGGGGGLGCLVDLPHCGDVLGPADGERASRLVRRLRAELDGRQMRRGPVAPPDVHLLVDGLPALLANLPERGPGGIDDLLRIMADGPAAGIHVAATAERPGAVPTGVAAHLPMRLALHLADPLDAAPLGTVAARAPRTVPGRAVDVADGHLVQLAWVPDDAVAALAAALRQQPGPAPEDGPTPVTVLPDVVGHACLAASSLAGGRLTLVVGIDDEHLGPASLEVRDGEHVLVAGPSRAGVSTALAALAVAGSAAGARVLAVVGPRSGLTALLPASAAATPHGGLGGVLDLLGPGDVPRLVVVDDAHDLDDHDGGLAALLGDPPVGVVVVAGGRTDLLRAAYGHWTRIVRRSRLGVLLQPTPELDGELLGTRLARSTAASIPGRGVLVEAGRSRVVQVALPHQAQWIHEGGRVAGSGG